ncbi:unnamed protein product [Closterium sp. Naga37s-1]|nr:unnamed protein product [Closterium sp. Naga37s-1]
MLVFRNSRRIWLDRHESVKRWNVQEEAVGAGKACARTAGVVSGGVGAQEIPRKLQLLCRADMVHYLDVRGGWDVAECGRCFHHAMSLRAERALERALSMESLDFVRSLLHNHQPGATPLACPNGVSRGVLEFSARVQAFGKQGESAPPPHVQFSCKTLVAELGAGRQVENDCCASMLVQVLGVKESAELQEGFGFFVRHLLADGLENAHAEGSGEPGRRIQRVWGMFSRPEHRKLGAMFFVGYKSIPTGSMEDAAIEAASVRLRQVGLASGMREGEDSSLQHQLHQQHGRLLRMLPLSQLELGLLLAGAIPPATWLRIYGSDFIFAQMCCKDNPQGRVLPMRHPVRDLPNLLAMFGAVLQPTVGRSCFPEWEEWPQGDEATMKFPDDPSARCFWLGRADGRQGLRNNGHLSAAVQQGRTRKARKAPSKEPLPPPRSEMRPIVRCRADADLIVEFAGMLFEPPACAHCSACIATYTILVPFVALVANFAYRPASALLDHFVSIFPPHTAEFQDIVNRLGQDGRTQRCSVHALQERVEQVPLSFLLALALLLPKELLQQSGAQGDLNSSAAGISYGAKGKAGRRRARSGDFMVRGGNTTTGAMEGGGPACSGSQSMKRATTAHKKLIAKMYDCSLLPRFCEDLKHTGGRGSACDSSGKKRKGKKVEEAAYLKAWPGGVNLVACLREMLLGEPCYRPAFDAARSTSAAVSTRAASSVAAPIYSATAAPSSDESTTVAALSTSAADVLTASVTSNVEAAGAAACGERVCSATATQGSGPAPSRGRVCGAAGCGRVEGGGVKLKSCGGCGKVAYCSRDCQKAHWPSHKLTCPGRTNGKRRGENSGKLWICGAAAIRGGLLGEGKQRHRPVSAAGRGGNVLEDGQEADTEHGSSSSNDSGFSSSSDDDDEV